LNCGYVALTVIPESLKAAEDKSGAKDVSDEDRRDADGTEDDGAAHLSTRRTLSTFDAAVDDDVRLMSTS
jgi:hypothetical protein